MTEATRARIRWAAVSLPMAPLALLAYASSEWLFFVTKPSPLASLPFGEQLAVLAKAPFPYLLPLVAIQAFASAVSLVKYPRVRAAAVVPAACVCGFGLLLLIDNFTYTVFGFGVLTAGEMLRVVYATLLPLLAVCAGWKLSAWLSAVSARRLAPVVAMIAIVFTVGVPQIAAHKPQTQPDDTLPQWNGAGSVPALPTRTGQASAARPNILFLGIDGVDARYLSAYGYHRPTSPFLEQFGRDALFFENAFSNATRTHGSLVTLLTGRLPFATKVTFPPTALHGEDTRRNLPMILKGLGYTTLQLALRHYADAEDVHLFGFDAANYHWQNLEDIKSAEPVRDETDVFREAVAERLDQRVMRLFGTAPVVDQFAQVEGRVVVPEWRDDRRVATLVQYFRQAPEPWFVHLHMLDTHCCNFAADEKHFTGNPSADARDDTFYEADQHARELVEALAAGGQLERTIIVVSSDHASGWKSTERVPLMIRFPNRAHAGRVPANVQLADVAPTILGYLGVQTPEWMDGLSLLDRENHHRHRHIYGVSDIGARDGIPGLRNLRDSGPPNYGATAAMLIAGHRWYELRLGSGEVASGEVDGHTRSDAPVVTNEEARNLILRQITRAGFQVSSTAPARAQ